MSNKVNTDVSEALQVVVDENAERAMLLQKSVSEKLEDLDIEGAMDLVSHYSEKNNTYWNMAIREMRGDVPDVIKDIFPTKEELRGQRDDEQYADDAERDKEKELERARI